MTLATAHWERGKREDKGASSLGGGSPSSAGKDEKEAFLSLRIPARTQLCSFGSFESLCLLHMQLLEVYHLSTG